MSQQLCVDLAWGSGRTQSISSPHPYLESLVSLTKDGTTERLTSYLSQATMKDLSRVATLPENWDHADSPAPTPAAVANAFARLPEICSMAIKSSQWVNPHVSASESGEITFEWWHADKKLTLYFGQDGVEAIRVWGPDIDEEMQHFHLERVEELTPSWTWLYGE